MTHANKRKCMQQLSRSDKCMGCNYNNIMYVPINKQQMFKFNYGLETFYATLWAIDW